MVKLVSRVSVVFLVVALLITSFPKAGTADSVSWPKIDPVLRSLMNAQPGGQWNVIVETTTPQAARTAARLNEDRSRTAAERLRAYKAKPKAKLSIIGSASGTADYGAIAALSRDPFVAYIHYDAPMRQQEVTTSGNVYEQVARATDAWKLGLSGKGIGVAVLDSGVFDSPDLTQPISRIATHVDLVGDGAGSSDPGGHGTHVAGIIAGNGYSAPQGLTAAFQGVAPNAQIVDVRVIGKYGGTSLSTVIAGVQWVVQNRSSYNIRVMNLSLGAEVPSTYTYQSDPLVAALDVAWLSGITVVVAAGNIGPNPRTIETPGVSPMLITVGALDDAGTLDAIDDTIPLWSSHGPTPNGLTKPDLVAPGRRIVSLPGPGSYLYSTLPDRVVTTSAGTYFRLSGTSMAAPVVAGVAALLLEKNPNLKPDQVKNILVKTTRPVSGFDANAVGAGAVDAYAAVTSNIVDKANRGKRPADAFARATLPLIKGQPLTWRDLNYAGRNWANITWDNITWDNITWDNITWDNILWDNILWDNITWDNITWDTTWSSVNQDSVSGQSSLFD